MSNKPQKPPVPKPLPAMRDIPVDVQDELIDRHGVRSDIIEGNKLLSQALKAWVNDLVMDSERFRNFKASGHHGTYETEYPEGTLARKLKDLGWTIAQIVLLAEGDTPLNLMSADELRFVYRRIQMMLDWFVQNPAGGTYQHACDIYEAVGRLVRRAVEQQTGQGPERFPTPDVIITGKESPKRLKPANYRALLLPPEEDES